MFIKSAPYPDRGKSMPLPAVPQSTRFCDNRSGHEIRLEHAEISKTLTGADGSGAGTSLNTSCPKCGYSIPPSQIARIDFERVHCPECREQFIPGAGKPRQQPPYPEKGGDRV
jgi:hypothetical protein